MKPLAFVLVIGGLVLSGPALAAEVSAHSGEIVAIDTAAHRLQLAEMGPWKGGRTRPAVHSFEFGPRTRFALVTRATGADRTGWMHGYVESVLTPSAVRPGDFATVTFSRSARQPEAATVEIVRPTSTKS